MNFTMHRFMRPLAVAVVLLAAASANADDKEKSKAAREQLLDIGMAYEEALSLAPDARAAALAGVNDRLRQLLDDGTPKEYRSSALLLHGEVMSSLGDFDTAWEAWKEAAKKAKKTPYVDDIQAAAIEALEVLGNDEEADRQWRNWLKDHGKSPLAGEVRLALAWNAIRRDSLRSAAGTIGDIDIHHEWMRRDERLELARAVVAYRQERYLEITIEPSGSDLDAAVLYVRGLTDIALDQPLKAAARFQQIVERHPGSRLRDHSMLAKANIFLRSNAYRSAVEEFAAVAEQASDVNVIAEADLRRAASVYLDGDIDAGIEALREVTSRYDGSAVAARAQMMLGEVLVDGERYEEAILAYNTVLTRYFDHALASGAQYRVGRCLDALDRSGEATSSYQAVVAGYSTSREAPAAAYLAGVGLLAQERPRAAAPYFQIVLDRYAIDKGEGAIEFATPERQETVEASLCLLQLSYHRSGDLGMLSGVPHMMLLRMPASKSSWRAYALLIDADALASQSRYDEAQGTLQMLVKDFPGHNVGAPALQLLAWTYAQQGQTDLAIATQEKLLAGYGDQGEMVSTAYLSRAHILFNKKEYEKSAGEYERFLGLYPEHQERATALFQAGMCYLRIGRDGDAVDRFESVVAENPSDPVAEKAWTRSADIYFRAGHYEEAKRSYEGLLGNFATAGAAAMGMLRIAQCDYNAGRYTESIEGFSRMSNQFPDHALAAEARKGIEQALYRLGSGDDGEASLSELVDRFPGSAFAADAQFEIAVRRYDEEDYAGAAEAFRRVVTQFPGASSADRAQYLMADSYSRAGDENSAKLAREQFLVFFPGSDYRSEVRLRLGVARFGEGDYMRAAVDFTTILSDSADAEIMSAALYNLALCRRILEDDAAAATALEEYETKYKGDDRAADVAYQLADIYNTADRKAEAADAYLRALEAGLDPELNVEAYYHLGVCREALGDIDGAVRAYKGARRSKDGSNPFRLTAVARMASIYEDREELEAAVKAYRDLIRNSKDEDVVVAAQARVSELEAGGAKR